ncbi:MAG: polysaccharide deacetylase family protein [Chromatiales bacterium]|jgi:allantoinase|nr:polysaccharide deacetylase family protein [Chromatiales bacterium]
MSDQIQRYRNGPGYDHEHYEWNPLPGRQPIQWPGGARTAIAALVYFEHMELKAPDGSVADPRFDGALGSYYPDFQNYSRREFGNRVGIFRVLDILERYGIRATICANAIAAAQYPYIVERCQRAGHSFIAHGWSISRMLSSKLSAEAEREHIDECLHSLTTSLGERPTGWAGQDYGESASTPQLLAQAGIRHVVDWPNDDEPYYLNTEPRIVSVPNQSEWDDAQLFAVRKVDSWRYPEIITSAFEQLHDEGGRMLGMGIHPWIFGQAHRVKYLEEAVRGIANQSGTWMASTAEIAQAYEQGQ